MHKVSLTISESFVVKTLVHQLARDPQGFKTQIDADDEMFLFGLGANKEQADRNRALVNYFTIGASICDVVRQVADWHFGALDQAGSFLDFACGHGRFTRFLVQEMAPQQIWAADIYPDAVRFQRGYLGVNGIDSASQPEAYAPGRYFDCILALSFFSHMPERTFTTWLNQLYGSLTPRGILMFSVHDASLLPAHVPMTPDGIVFATYSESRSLDMEEYGTTYVTEAYVRACVAQISGGQASVQRVPGGICGFQDLYAVTRQDSAAAAPLSFRRPPKGCVDSVAPTASGQCYLDGWVFDGSLNGAPVEIQVYLNDQHQRSIVPSFERGDVATHFNAPKAVLSGWYCLLAPGWRDDDILLIKAVDADGSSMILACDEVAALAARRIPATGQATLDQREQDDLRRAA